MKKIIVIILLILPFVLIYSISFTGKILSEYTHIYAERIVIENAFGDEYDENSIIKIGKGELFDLNVKVYPELASNKEFTISIPEVLSLDGRQICVRVYGDNGVFVLQGSDGTSTLPYQVYSNANAEQALASGDVFAIFTQEGEQSGFVRIDQKDILKTDTYTGNLRFSFFVGDVEE